MKGLVGIGREGVVWKERYVVENDPSVVVK